MNVLTEDDDDDFTVKVVDGPEAEHYQHRCRVADEEPCASTK